MTLALIPSNGRSRVESAARLLRQAITELHAAAREEDQARERAAMDAQREERARQAQVEARRRSRMITLDRGWLERFADALRETADDVGRAGERAHANQLGNLIAALGEELEKTYKASR
jgi:hypothetical protein